MPKLNASEKKWYSNQIKQLKSLKRKIRRSKYYVCIFSVIFISILIYSLFIYPIFINPGSIQIISIPYAIFISSLIITGYNSIYLMVAIPRMQSIENSLKHGPYADQLIILNPEKFTAHINPGIRKAINGKNLIAICLSDGIDHTLLSLLFEKEYPSPEKIKYFITQELLKARGKINQIKGRGKYIVSTFSPNKNMH